MYFVVFYNGIDEAPDKQTLHLSDAFKTTPNDNELTLELVVDVYNINAGHNSAMLDSCNVLKEYSEFVKPYTGQPANTAT